MTDYRPIACHDYDLYEIAIMRGQRLWLQWRDDDGECRRAEIRPRDLKISDGAEYLLVETVDREIREIRLDRIEGASPTD